METAAFYGTSLTSPRLRHLESARDIVSASNSNELQIVLLPPATGDKGIDSDEEGDDNILDEDYMPVETAGEVEMHGDEFDEEDTNNEIPANKKWRKAEDVSLSEVDSVKKCDEVMLLGGESMYDIFLRFFTENMIDHIVEQSNLYAIRDKNMHNFKTDRDEMKKFIGLLIISGYHHLPSENDYWSTADDMNAPIFHSIMSRDRFRTMKRFLHIADNNNLANSKVAKVLPLFDKLKENCLQFGIFHQFLSIDESMVPYRGLHSARQYIKGKPVKFGYKIWMLCSSNGFPYNFELYCGKS